jgi:predicted O-methyltransferase YrrM
MSNQVALPQRAMRKLRRRATREWNRVARFRGLSLLERRPDPLSHALARAIQATACDRAAPRERVWIDRIDLLRGELEASAAVLERRLSEVTGSKADHDTISANTVSDISREKSAPRLWGLLLFRLIRELEPRTVLELGTGLGVSGAYQAAALEINGKGRLITIEASESRVALARGYFEQLGLHRVELRHGRFQDILRDVLEEAAAIEFAFVDGEHAERATVGFFEEIAARMPSGGVMVFDDLTWSEGMRRAWRRISSDARVGLAVELGRMGLCVRGSGDGPPPKLTIPLP